MIALVQPLDGGTLYADRPVIVLRFAAGEALDPIDVGSFTIAVDGDDRTSLFQKGAGEAWGPLAPTSGENAPLVAGPHRISARICSARGACATTHATVTVLPAMTADAASAVSGGSRSRKQRLLDAALNAARRLLVP